MSIPVLTAVLLVLLLGIAFATALLRDALAATVVFAAYSLVMAILWILLGAPDVALTEAAVGAGVATSLFLLAIVGTTRPVDGPALVRNVEIRSVGAAGAVTLAVLATLPALPASGSATTPPFQRVSPFYLERAVTDFGTSNVVTAILVGYRGFDTFGEVVVVFAAGIAVLVVFRGEVR